LLNKLGKETELRITDSQMDQEIAGVAALRAVPSELDTPPTQELPVELANVPPPGLSRSRRRYGALAAAVRVHERDSSHPAVPKRPVDHALYAALTELESTIPAPGDQLR
jgi:hypothetical protein